MLRLALGLCFGLGLRTSQCPELGLWINASFRVRV